MILFCLLLTVSNDVCVQSALKMCDIQPMALLLNPDEDACTLFKVRTSQISNTFYTEDVSWELAQAELCKQAQCRLRLIRYIFH